MELDPAVSCRSIDVDEHGGVWVGGSKNSIFYSSNNGVSWTHWAIADSLELDFRGIKCLGNGVVVAMSSGLSENGSAKIFRTSSNGKYWNLVHNSTISGVFMDGVAFQNNLEGYVYGDPLLGSWFLLHTIDGGLNWQRKTLAVSTEVEENEASFAASNSNINFQENRLIIASQSRLFTYQSEHGLFDVTETGVMSGATAGIFGMQSWQKENIFLLLGDYKESNSVYPNAAMSSNAGETWEFHQLEPSGLLETAVKMGDLIFVAGANGIGLTDIKFHKTSRIANGTYHASTKYKDLAFFVGAKGSFCVLRVLKN